MDGLTECTCEKALSWNASWEPSFDGVAIVNSDFTFRGVNPQFCKIVGVSPAELIGKSFADITPQPVRGIDVKNATLVMQGNIRSYLLPKTYEFYNGRRVKVQLLVVGVYDVTSPLKEFQFFVSRIMLDEGIKSLTPDRQPIGLLKFLKDNSKLLAGIGAALGTFIITILNYLKDN